MVAWSLGLKQLIKVNFRSPQKSETYLNLQIAVAPTTQNIELLSTSYLKLRSLNTIII